MSADTVLSPAPASVSASGTDGHSASDAERAVIDAAVAAAHQGADINALATRIVDTLSPADARVLADRMLRLAHERANHFDADIARAHVDAVLLDALDRDTVRIFDVEGYGQRLVDHGLATHEQVAAILDVERAEQREIIEGVMQLRATLGSPGSLQVADAALSLLDRGVGLTRERVAAEADRLTTAGFQGLMTRQWTPAGAPSYFPPVPEDIETIHPDHAPQRPLDRVPVAEPGEPTVNVTARHWLLTMHLDPPHVDPPTYRHVLAWLRLADEHLIAWPTPTPGTNVEPRLRPVPPGLGDYLAAYRAEQAAPLPAPPPAVLGRETPTLDDVRTRRELAEMWLADIAPAGTRSPAGVPLPPRRPSPPEPATALATAPALSDPD